MVRCRNGKIVATIGPSSHDFEKLEQLHLAGVDVFRLNFSHSSYEEHTKVYNAIRAIGRKHHTFSTILADLQGPKLRIGAFTDGKVFLEVGDVLRLDLNSTPGDKQRVYIPHPEILSALYPGAVVLMDDGKLKFEVTSCSEDHANLKVLVGGTLSDRKGVSVPDVKLPIPALTEKDLKDLDFVLKLGVDWIALSFVQIVEDIEEAKNIIKGRAGVVSKLEKPVAIKNLEPIVAASDAIMVARGDLGVEMDQEELPGIQRNIVKTCRRLGKPVIVATQMLESMITSPIPTRAEVSDIANASYQYADATMLSAETAAGKYPLEAVTIMDKIIKKTEQDPSRIISLEDINISPHVSDIDSLCAAAKIMAEYSSAKAIILFAGVFETIVRCSRFRPHCPIIFITDSTELACKSGLCNGVYAFFAEGIALTDEATFSIARATCLERKFADIGDKVIILNSIKETIAIRNI